MHSPAVQPSAIDGAVVEHSRPQPPQFASSVCVSTQAPPQGTRPPVQVTSAPELLLLAPLVELRDGLLPLLPLVPPVELANGLLSLPLLDPEVEIGPNCSETAAKQHAVHARLSATAAEIFHTRISIARTVDGHKSGP
jgi:hypothetical protein